MTRTSNDISHSLNYIQHHFYPYMHVACMYLQYNVYIYIYIIYAQLICALHNDIYIDLVLLNMVEKQTYLRILRITDAL